MDENACKCCKRRYVVQNAVKGYATEYDVNIVNVMNTAFTYFQEVLYFVNEDLKNPFGLE